jgi:hypothetical protein
MTQYKNIKTGEEFVFNGVTFVKINWIASQIKGKRKFISLNPSVEVTRSISYDDFCRIDGEA